MTWDDDFLCVIGDHFSEMRLLVEGAIVVYEDDAGELYKLARDAEKNEAQLALNDIGTALYAFRNHIRKLQAAHHKAATQEPEEAEGA